MRAFAAAARRARRRRVHPDGRGAAEKPLDIQFIDVEGGQATLFVLAVGRIAAGGHRMGRLRRPRRRPHRRRGQAGRPLEDRLSRHHPLPRRSRRRRAGAGGRACRSAPSSITARRSSRASSRRALFNAYLETRAKATARARPSRRHAAGRGPRRARRLGGRRPDHQAAPRRRPGEPAVPRLQAARRGSDRERALGRHGRHLSATSACSISAI